ncbi:MAG: phage tail tube protein [Pseudomonadota bacterium]
MTYANSSETEVAFVEESAWGVTPASPAFQRLRLTGESLTHTKENVVSEEITPTADVADEVGVGSSGTGGVNFELTFGDQDTGVMLAHALRADWALGTGADQLEDLVAGTAKKSMTLQKKFALDAGSDFNRYPGMRVNTLSLTVDENGLVTGTTEFIGKGEEDGTTELAGATYVASNTGRPMSSVGVANIAVGGIGGQLYFSSLSLNIANNCEAQNALGTDVAVGVRYGQREVTGNLTAYLNAASRPLYERFKDGTKGSLSFEFSADGESYVVTMPAATFNEGTKNAAGNSEDVVIELSFRANLDASLGSSIMVQRTATEDV